MSEDNSIEVREKQELQGEGTRPGPAFRPDVDILERSDGFVIFADLPGVDDTSVEVRLHDGTLTLEAQLATLPDRSWRPLREEYQVGSYRREFRLSEGIDQDGVSAKMHNGVLELRIPKSAERQPRSIPVQAG